MRRNPIGRAVALWEETDGLHGTFIVRESAHGDEALADIMDGYLPACSVGFKPTTVGRGQQGETVVMAGDLREVGRCCRSVRTTSRRCSRCGGRLISAVSGCLARRQRRLVSCSYVVDAWLDGPDSWQARHAASLSALTRHRTRSGGLAARACSELSVAARLRRHALSHEHHDQQLDPDEESPPAPR